MNEFHARADDAGAQTSAQPATWPSAAAAGRDTWRDGPAPGGPIWRAVLEVLPLAALVVRGPGEVVYANPLAHHMCLIGRLLRVQAGVLRAVHPAAHRQVEQGMLQALRGEPVLLVLRHEADLQVVSLMPLCPQGPWAGQQTEPLLLVLLGRRGLASTAALEQFAAHHRITEAETAVLLKLSRGLTPEEVAQTSGVRLATVRSQILAVRQKTGAASIRHLLQMMAEMPPLVRWVRGSAR